MLNNILTTTVNPIPKDLAILNGLNADLTIENTKLKKLLCISVGIIVILTTITIIHKNEDRN